MSEQQQQQQPEQQKAPDADPAPWARPQWWASRKFVSAALLTGIGLAVVFTGGAAVTPIAVLAAASPLLGWIGIEGAADVAGALRGNTPSRK